MLLAPLRGHLQIFQRYKEKARWGRYRAKISYREILERINNEINVSNDNLLR